MPDSKITALTALTAADPANDMFPVVDVSDTTMAASGTTKRISINNILACSPSATLASATITGALGAAGLNVTGATIPANGVYLGSANNLSFSAASTLGMTLNANGLFLGISSQAFAEKLRVYGSYTLMDDGAFTGFLGKASSLGVSGATTDFGIRSSNALIFLSGGATERMRIDTSGNVGIGVTPSAWATYKAVSVGGIGASVFGLGSSQAGVAQGAFFNNGAGSGWAYSATSQVPTYYLQINGENIWNIAPSGTAGAQITAWTSAMKLDASGNLLVGTTNTSPSVGVGFKANYSATLPAFSIVVNDAAGTGAAYTLYNTNAAAYRFYVANSGTIFATNTTISAISDQRLKENVQDIDVGLGAILALKPRKFDWKAGKGKDIKGDRGFIAQEFETVFPNLIDEWKDEAPEGEAPYKSVRQDLIPVLVKAIQELTARVQTLETR